MAGHSVLRGLLGQYMPGQIQFAEIEAGVVDGQSVNLVGVVGGELAGVQMPLGGYIIGVSVGSEASAGFGVTPSINGTDAAAAYDVAVTAASAAAQATMYATPLAFSAGDYIGLNFEGTVSAQKDMNATLFYVLDLAGG